MVSSTPANAPEWAARSPNRYLPALTGLRAVAAGLVFLHHYNPAASGTYAYRLFQQGYIGVSLFFVLSGFLIYYRYADLYLSQKNWSWRAYGINRFARIYPLYALLLLGTVLVEAVRGRAQSSWMVWLDGTLLNGFFDVYKFGTIPQSWSLTVEVTFYGLAPFLFAGLNRLGALWLTALLAGAGLLLWVTVGQVAWGGFFGNLPFVWFYTFFGRSFEFVVGMWLARQWYQKKLPVHSFSGWLGLGIVLLCVLWQSNFLGDNIPPAALLWSEVVAYNALLPVGIGLLFVSLLTQNSSLKNVLAQPVFQALGRSSFAFYLIHTGVIANGIQKAGVTNKGLLFGVLSLVAWLLYWFVEKPSGYWLRRCHVKRQG